MISNKLPLNITFDEIAAFFRPGDARRGTSDPCNKAAGSRPAEDDFQLLSDLKVEGILGINLFHDLVLTLDIPHGKIILSQKLKDKAKEFLKYFSIKYHWISYDEKTTEIDALDKALLQAPVQIAIQTCPPWMDNSAINACSFSSPNHCIMIYDYNQLWKVLDQYPEYLKTLSHDYLIPFAMQYIVTPIPQPESVFVPSVPLIDSSEITSKKITLIQLILSKMRQLLDLLTKK